jgi:hypothetical protein
VVQVVMETVAEHGYAELRGVPGDHQAALRKHVRSAVKKRTGYGTQTLVHESMVIFVCEPIHQRHAEGHARAAAEAMESFFNGKSATPLQAPWRLYCRALAKSLLVQLTYPAVCIPAGCRVAVIPAVGGIGRLGLSWVSEGCQASDMGRAARPRSWRGRR